MVGASWCDCVQCPAPAGGSARRVVGRRAAEEAVLWGRRAGASCEESPSPSRRLGRRRKWAEEAAWRRAVLEQL
jgi:hypothetical protein